MLKERKQKYRKESSDLERASLIVNDFLKLGLSSFIKELSEFYGIDRRLLQDMVTIKLSQYSLDNVEIEIEDVEFLARTSALSLMNRPFTVNRRAYNLLNEMRKIA